MFRKSNRDTWLIKAEFGVRSVTPKGFNQTFWQIEKNFKENTSLGSSPYERSELELLSMFLINVSSTLKEAPENKDFCLFCLLFFFTDVSPTFRTVPRLQLVLNKIFAAWTNKM